MQRTRMAGLCTLVVLALCAGTAATATAAVGPYYKVEGARLNGGKGIKANGTETYVFKIAFTENPTVRCKEMTYANGAEIKGLNKKESDTGTATIVFKMCTVEKNGAGCTVENGEIKTQPLVDVLGYSEIERKGNILILFHPATGKTIAGVKFAGGGCVIKEGQLEGSFAGEMLDKEKKSIPVEGGAESMVNYVKFATGQITGIGLEVAEGMLKNETVKLFFNITNVGIVETTITGESELELAGSEIWTVDAK